MPKDSKDLANPPADYIHRQIDGGESVQGPLLPQVNQPTLIRNPKLEELYERKKNWIYDSPNNVDRAKEIEEALGVRKYEYNGMAKKPKGAVEQFMEENKDRKSFSKMSGSKDSLLQGGLNKRELGREGDNEDDLKDKNGVIQELNPAYLFNWTLPSETLSPLGSAFKGTPILPKGIGEPAFGDRAGSPSFSQGSATIQRDPAREWEARRNGTLGRINDPINDTTDATRSFLNPISARKTTPPPSDSGTSKSADPFAFGSISSLPVRSDLFGPGRDRPSAGPSFTPTPAAMPSGTIMQPKPVILEIPRPKF